MHGGHIMVLCQLAKPSAARKVMKHVRTLKKLWKAVELLIDLLI